MTVVTEAPGIKVRRFNMRLNDNQYLEEHGGWLKAGDVLTVDEDTAVRWLENNIATQAGPGDKTAKEIKRAALLAKLTPIEVDEDDEPRRQPIGTPKRRGRPTIRPELVGAGVVNSLDETPEDVIVEDDE